MSMWKQDKMKPNVSLRPSTYSWFGRCSIVLLFQNIFMEQSITTKPRRRRTQQQIRDLLTQFNKANCTVKEFCRVNHISHATFHKWRSRLRNKAQKDSSPGFAEVVVRSASPDVLFAEVNGIRIYQPVSAAYLKELFG